ncbi:MAG: HD domain-containing protein [Clostridia bacterium]|nr:HD domain-containing protein [Clostridia bacterium]MBR5632912.1 HD domain-containing protein [Clostridia bacterium]
MDEKRFQKQLDFILETDKEKKIYRQTHITGYERRENDAEHAWHMAVMIYLLREWANEDFDVAKAMIMALIHDVVEIDAGDTYAYDEEALKSKEDREKAAADRIFGILPEDQRDELRALFEEFEAGETPEAKFARTMDNFQPLLLNDSNGGRDWREHGVTKAQVTRRQRSSQLGSDKVWSYTEGLIGRNVEKGNIKDE